MYGGSNNAGNVWTANAAPMAPYPTAMNEIHVLLVDHDPNALFEIGRMLEMCSYKVTLANYASTAIAMLSNQKTMFDVVMASTESQDLQGYKLMQLAVAMGIPFVLLSIDEGAFFTTKAVLDGAFLNIHKPVPINVLKYLWQFVLREKTQKILRDQRELNVANNNFNYELTQLLNHMDESFEMEHFGGSNMNGVLPVENNEGNQIVRENDVDMYDDEYYGAVNHGPESHRVKRKVCTEWTDELHSKFVDAVLTLGDGRCFPKEIMQLMNVPGLTRMQVASHLQKCRNETWRSSEERKNQLTIQLGSNSDANSSLPLVIRTRRFGSMPRVNGSLANRTNGGSSSQYLTEPDGIGMVQNVMGGSTEPMNQLVNNNPQNVEDYGTVVPRHRVFPETDGDYGAAALVNASDEFFNFSDLHNIISTPYDSFAGLFNSDLHEPYFPNQNDNTNVGNYDQQNGAGPSGFGNQGSNVNASG